MSFILDALKKSESERQRQAGPALMEVRIAPPRSRLPLWALLVGALLMVNILVLGAVLVFRERGAPATAAVAPAPPASSATQAPGPAAALAAPLANTAPPLVQPLIAPAPTPPAAMQGTPLLDTGNASLNPADYVPALPAGSVTMPARVSSEDNALPTREDLVAANQPVPELHLSLHVYDAMPANRYVLINSSRLREGDAMADGTRLERITENGVVLSWRGNRFRLRQGD